MPSSRLEVKETKSFDFHKTTAKTNNNNNQCKEMRATTFLGQNGGHVWKKENLHRTMITIKSLWKFEKINKVSPFFFSSKNRS